MAEGRRELIQALAWSLDDLLPLPATSTGSIVRGSSVRGEGPSRRVACSACDGEGRLVDRFGRSVPCLVCGGRVAGDGHRARRGSGRVAVDAYTERQVATVEGPATVVRVERVGCAWCQTGAGGRSSGGLPRGCGVRAGRRCEACDGSGWRELTRVDPLEVATGDAGGGGVEAALDRRAAAGSYRELERTLSALRVRAPRVWRVWVAVVRFEVPARSGDGRVVEAGWRFVEAWMPGRVRVPSGVLVAWRARGERGRVVGRDERIRADVLRGVPVRQVALEVGLSESRVQRIAYGSGGGLRGSGGG